jgi:hypothetical protein
MGKMKCLDFPTYSLFNDVVKKYTIEIISIFPNVRLTLHVGISDTGREYLL